MTTSTLIKPVSKKERIIELDVIRGFALLGVLLVNILWFSATFFMEMTSTSPVMDPMGQAGIFNQISALFILLFAESKFYTIFSFLFGLGFYIFMERAEQKTSSPNKLFLRRTLFLFLFGLLHYTLVWFGDILQIYGATGLLLLFFRNRQLKTIKRWIVGLLIISTLVICGSALLDSMSPMLMGEQAFDAYETGMQQMTAESIKTYQDGSYLEIVNYRLQNETFYRIMGYVFQVPKVLALFLMGLYAGKARVFSNLSSKLGKVRKLWTIGGIFGTLATVIYVVIKLKIIMVNPVLASTLDSLVKEIGSVFLALFYITTLILLYHNKQYKKLVMPLRYVGKMALTNYLSQCVILSVIFYGHGLALNNRVGAGICLVIAIVIYSAQIVTSKAWLSNFKYGPCEWVWRRLTYGRNFK